MITALRQKASQSFPTFSWQSKKCQYKVATQCLVMSWNNSSLWPNPLSSEQAVTEACCTARDWSLGVKLKLHRAMASAAVSAKLPLCPSERSWPLLSPVRHHCPCLQPTVPHWDHLSGLSQLMALTLLCCGCSPARKGLGPWEYSHGPNLCIGLQNSASIAQTGRFQFTNTKDNFFASCQQCNYPFWWKAN